MNIARIYDQKYSIILDHMYNKVNVSNFEGLDEPMDINGYLGKTKYYRTHVKQSAISSQEFIEIVHADNKLVEIMRTINEIDKEHNGYVTVTELDDILKLNYGDILECRDLIPIIKKFSSIQNRILIDYKGFRDWVKLEIKKLDFKEQLKSEKGSTKLSSKNKELVQKIEHLEKKVDQMRLKEDLIENQIKEYSEYHHSKKSNKELNSKIDISRNESMHDGSKTCKQQVRQIESLNPNGPLLAYTNEAHDTNRDIKNGNVTPSQKLTRKKLEQMKRPSTSHHVGSRKASIPLTKDRSITAAKFMDKDMAANEYDAAVSNSKYVSISQLMKNKRQFGNTLMNMKEEGEDFNESQYNLHKTMKRVASLSHHRNDLMHNDLTLSKSKIVSNLKTDVNLETEAELLKHFSHIKPTDDKTLQRILSFANELTQDDPMKAHLTLSNKSILDNYNHAKFNTISDKNTFNHNSKANIALEEKTQASSVFVRSKFENRMIHKLAYEWKNIYRALSSLDCEGRGVISLSNFEQILQKQNVSIVRDEMKQLLRMFGQDMEHGEPDHEEELINYKRLSIQLGLHKESYNYLNKVQNINKENNMTKLRQLYQSIESPKKYRNDESFETTDRQMKKNNSKNGHFSLSNLNNNDYYSNIKTISPYNNNNKAR